MPLMYELKANLKGRFESFRQRIVEYELLPDSDMDPWTLATAPVVKDNSGGSSLSDGHLKPHHNTF